MALSLCGFAGVYAAAADTDAMAQQRRWVKAKFQAGQDAPPEAARLLAHLTSAPLVKNGIKGFPLSIAGQKFEGGLVMLSTGDVRVELPSAARAFSAVLGVDSNDLSYYSNVGRGSVVASVESGGQELYRSPVLHEGMPGIPAQVELGGARSFVLRQVAFGPRTPIDQADWDRTDWADARVTLVDGSVLRLADIPVGPAERYAPQAPFSFQYDGKPSAGFLTRWTVRRRTRRIDGQRQEYTSIYEDPATHLIVRCVAIAYDDFPVAEWTVYLKNGGKSRTPILEKIQALEAEFLGPAEGPFILHRTKGSSNDATDFQALETALEPESRQGFGSEDGFPTQRDMPYFNLSFSGRGQIFALGWPGEWALDMSRDQSNHVRVVGGQELTHLRLEPGEEIRTPLAVVQFYDGDWLDGQNQWRRWMLAHNLPRVRGQLPPFQLAGGSAHDTVEMQLANEGNQKEFLERVLKAGMPIDYWWMDAGWYPFKGGWWNPISWLPDPARFPRGLRPIADEAHARGAKTVVWFEPERVTKGSWLWENRPEWLIGPNPDQEKILFLGNPGALNWIVERVSRLVKSEKIGVYRQDCNFSPLPLWRGHDSPDRQGMTEIQHVEGFLAYFDELRRRSPDLRIDICAGGGRRLDLETLRRSVPLWRTDYVGDPVVTQSQTYGLALWVPYFGTAFTSQDPYYFRSQITPAVGIGMSLQAVEQHQEELRALLAQWRGIADFYYGDFFPLTPFSAENSAWMAWQFHRPDEARGMVQAFRRGDSPFEQGRFKLRGLDASAIYLVKDLDTQKESEFSGKALLEQGLPVTIAKKPGAVMLVYRRRA
jgi:alpha-galactosidase